MGGGRWAVAVDRIKSHHGEIAGNSIHKRQQQPQKTIGMTEMCHVFVQVYYLLYTPVATVILCGYIATASVF